MGGGYEMMAVARNLAQDGTFANPFYALPTGPTAVEPPLYPLFVALAIRVFGAHSMVPYWVVIFANIFANALVAALLPWVSAALWGTCTAGIAAALLAIAAFRPMTAWDASFTQLGLVLLTILAAAQLAKPGRFVRGGAIVGAFAGLLFLLNPASVLVSIPCAAFFAVRSGAPRQWIRFAVPLVLAAALVNLPWLARNYAIWGRPIVRTNFGMTLYASNNDCAQPGMIEEEMAGCYDTKHPNTNLREAELLRSLGEPEYDRRRTADGLAWIRANPSRFVWLTRMRILQFWLPRPGPLPYTTYAVWILTILSLPGLVWMARRREAAVLLFLVEFLIYPLAYYVVVANIRYRVPILWMSCLAAGYFLVGAFSRIRRYARQAAS